FNIGSSQKTRKLAKTLLHVLRQQSLQSVSPNIDISLWIFLTLPVTNAGGERSFSKLALIKNKLRSSMDQVRLNNLTLMSIEYDLLRQLHFSDIEDFSALKTRKK
ncbi:hypothetical protein G0U57_004475, partial [Chelydra serpentina]